MIRAGRTFFKMTGSGNDFIVFDARHEPAGALASAPMIQKLCARGTGVGADGIVFLEPSRVASVRLTYLNADGTRADFCGNATLCTTRLAGELGLPEAGALTIETDAGVIAARMDNGRPEIDLQPVETLEPEVGRVELSESEQKIGFALVGVPHLTVLCGDVRAVDVVGRGRPLRYHRALASGANINFVSPKPEGHGEWLIRTYERGVEAETLACGSGAVATAVMLTVWNVAKAPVELETRSGQILRVRLKRAGDAWQPSLSGEGRIVYKGVLAET